MSSSDPSANGGVPSRSKLSALDFEPIDASELNTDDIPTVEMAAYRRPGFGFWKALLWCVLFLFVTQILPAVILGVGILAVAANQGDNAQIGPDWLSSAQGQRAFQLALFIGQIATVIFSVLVLRWVVGREWKRKIGMRWPSASHIMLVVIAMPALLTLSIAVEPVVARYVPSLTKYNLPSMEKIVNETRTWPWMIAVLLIGIGPAIGEELWCRGFLGQGLASRYGNWIGVLLTSFFFGLIHIDPLQAAMAFFMGIILHLAYLASRSIVVPMLMHFLNNTLAILAISDTGSVPIASSLEMAYQHSPGLAIAATVLLLVTVGALLHRCRVRILTPSFNEVPQSLFPHVATPSQTGKNTLMTDDIPVLEMGALIVAVALFSAIWYGL